MSYIKKINRNGGLTLVELMMTVTILGIISVVTTSMFISINNIQVKSIVKEGIQEEMRTLMEKLVQDIRNKSIDYRGYYIMNGPHPSLGELDRDDSNRSYIGNPDPFPTGGDVLNPAPNFLNDTTHMKREDILILLDNDGKSRVKYRLAQPDDADLPQGVMISEQEYSMLGTCHSLPELGTPYDGSHSWDGNAGNDPDYCWVLKENYEITENDGYLVLSSPKISITDLKFIFQVHKSPFKVYEEDAVQLQPMLTISMTGTSATSEVIIGTVPTLTLQTTVTLRNYKETDWSTL